MELTVECQKRPEGSKPNGLRQQGMVPAVLYGHQGAESVSLVVKAKTVEKLLKEGSVNNTLITLNVTDLPWNGKTLLREVQLHPWKGYPYHLSFFSVSAQESLTVAVPLNFTGEAKGVKDDGGVLDLVLTELQLNCAPDNIPETIDIDISQLEIGDSLHVHELVLPAGVTVASDADRVVITVLQPRVSATEDTGTTSGTGV